MKTDFYTIECITNLHVGSGGETYNIVDNEVEKDPVTGLPMIHGSGIKGALREAFVRENPQIVDEVFGQGGNKDIMNSGTHKFLDGYLLARPMRVGGSSAISSVLVLTVSSLNLFLSQLSALGKNPFGIEKLTAPDFGDNLFLSTVPNINIEGEKTGVLEGETLDELKLLSVIIGTEFALATDFAPYDLPVLGRNKINANSTFLWYEEVVPHGSILYFGILSYDDAKPLSIPEIVQFGGHSSIGYGFCKVKKL